MKSFPFNLPESLQSHLDLFERDQDKAIYMLERHLTRRGYDAVGYFLLGWFYLMQDKHDEALRCAVKARTYAPGSPFFMHLPYYFQHPALFDAWLPENYNQPAAVTSMAYQRDDLSNAFFVDIDSLINRLSQRKRGGAIRPEEDNSEAEREAAAAVKGKKKKDKKNAPPKYGTKVATRTLALIYEQHEEYQKAIEVYELLRGATTDEIEQARFDDEIERLRDELSDSGRPDST